VINVRLVYTVVVIVIVVWLPRAGNPLGGLVVVRAAAAWRRRDAESGRLAGRMDGCV